PEDIFAEQGSVRFEQVADALGDDASLPRARARDHQQRPFAVGDRAPLRLVRRQLAAVEFPYVKKCGHDSRSVAYLWGEDKAKEIRVMGQFPVSRDLGCNLLTRRYAIRSS